MTQSALGTCQRTAPRSAASSPTMTKGKGFTHFTQTCNAAPLVFPKSMRYERKVPYPASNQTIFRKVVLLSWNVISLPPVKLNPPFNLTVKVGSDSNLWYYWNQTDPPCEENEVRYRINNRVWDVSQRKDTSQTFPASWASLPRHFSPVLSSTEFRRQLQELLHQPPLHQLPL